MQSCVATRAAPLPGVRPHTGFTTAIEFPAGAPWPIRVRPAVVLLDNRFVPGSSTPVAGRDAEGNTCQERTLADGSVHRVLKNFPSREQLVQAVAGAAREVRYREWTYYWALEYNFDAR